MCVCSFGLCIGNLWEMSWHLQKALRDKPVCLKGQKHSKSSSWNPGNKEIMPMRFLRWFKDSNCDTVGAQVTCPMGNKAFNSSSNFHVMDVFSSSKTAHAKYKDWHSSDWNINVSYKHCTYNIFLMYVRIQYTYAYINYMICDVWHFCFPCLQDLPKNSVAPCLFVSVFESLSCKSQNLAHHTVANVPSGHPVLQGPCHNEQPDPGLDMKQNFRRMLSKKQETSCKRSKRSNCNKHIKTSKSSKGRSTMDILPSRTFCLGQAC